MADEVDGIVYRAESFLAIGQTDRADTLVRGALAQDPADGRLLLTLTKVLTAQRRWTDVVACARATLAADANLLSAHILMAAAAHQLDDPLLVAEQAGIVLAHHPTNAVALMYLALSETWNRTDEGRARARRLYRLAIEHSSGGTPWIITRSADIELHLGASSEAERLIDDGLTRYPTDPDLLTAKAALDSTETEAAFGILSGLLASSPADPFLRGRFDALVARRRRRFLVLLWLLPASLATGLTFLDGGWRFAWCVLILVVGFFAGASRLATNERLPEHYRAELRSYTPWRLATRIGSRVAVVCLVLGGLQLAGGLAVGAWLLLVSALGWLASRAANLVKERAAARLADEEIAASQPSTSQPSALQPGPMWLALARGRWERSITTPVLLVPFAVVALVPVDAAEHRAAGAVVGLIASIVGLASITESLRWKPARLTGRFVAPRRALVTVMALLLATLFVVSGGTLVEATADWSEAKPPSQAPDTEVTIPPDFFDETTPGPTVSVPPLEIPRIDVPDLPRLEPPPSEIPPG